MKNELNAIKYLALKNQVRRFRNIELLTIDDAKATSEINRYGNLLDNYNTANPQPSKARYKEAKKGIIDGETRFKVDSENI